MSAERLRRVYGIVHGFVQGVGFRAYARRQAATCGVSGWVRNRADGAVEFCAEGSVAAVEEYLTAMRRGPGYSEVEQVAVLKDEFIELPTGSGFEIRF